jgi:hypothetical protein
MMKRVIFASLALMVSMTAMAQEVMDDGSLVILPVEAQNCDLPSGPPPIPDVPEKADLLKAQRGVKQFQTDMQTYRDCVNQYSEGTEVTTGNVQAISNAHNYSVDMEERVATMFNDAVREYKARLAKDS